MFHILGSIAIPKEAKIHLYATRSGNVTTFGNGVNVMKENFPSIKVDMSKAAFDAQGIAVTEFEIIKEP
jgi:hypothetical protein